MKSKERITMRKEKNVISAIKSNELEGVKFSDKQHKLFLKLAKNQISTQKVRDILFEDINQRTRRGVSL